MTKRGVGNVAFVSAMAVVISLLAAGLFDVKRGAAALRLETPYQAVQLSSGQTYYGKLAGLGTPYPVLTEVFFVQSQTDPTTRQVSNTLVRLNKAWHRPDRVYLNASHIVLVEPVNPESRVAELIRQADNR
jgi:hypothetical protein